MESTGPGFGSLLIVVVLVFMVIYVRQGRSATAAAHLPKGQRIRPLRLELIDPVLILLIVGSVLWTDVTKSWLHALFLIIGLALGIPIGLFRARVMLVRAIPSQQSVVLTRSGVEYAMLAILVVLKIVEDALNLEHTGPSVLGLIVTLLMALGLGESVARTTVIVVKYRAASRQDQPAQ